MDLSRINAELEGAGPEDILRWAIGTFPYRAAMTTSFQASGVVLLHFLRNIAFDFPVFFIDTGRHFPETLEFKARLTREWRLNVHTIIPESGTGTEDGSGEPLHETDPDLCCRLNKVEPFRALKKEIGVKAWISALRRDQDATRRDLHPVMRDGEDGLRVHPLLRWTKDRVWACIHEQGLPYHPLYDQGYTSIGCFPPACTLKNGTESEERAGRWAGKGKRECGLHTGLKHLG